MALFRGEGMALAEVQAFAEHHAKGVWKRVNGRGRRRGPQTELEFAQMLAVLIDKWERDHGRPASPPFEGGCCGFCTHADADHVVRDDGIRVCMTCRTACAPVPSTGKMEDSHG